MFCVRRFSRADAMISFFATALLCWMTAVGCSSEPVDVQPGESCDEEGAVGDGYVCEDGTWMEDQDSGDADANVGEADTDDNDVNGGGEPNEGEDCACEVDGTCFEEGETGTDEACSICDPDEAEDALVDAPDGTECHVDIDEGCIESMGSCEDGSCMPIPICAGTDTECGCTECVDCTEQDGWVDEGEPYDCCDGDDVCVCQDQVLREYSCDGHHCVYEETDEQTVFSDCESCGDDEMCEDAACVCAPDCDGLDCGDDGCGGSCGTCDDDEMCRDGYCTPTSGGSCTSDDDCGDYSQCCNGDCIPNTQQCDDDPSCNTDDDCGDMAYCCNGQCIPNTQVCTL